MIEVIGRVLAGVVAHQFLPSTLAAATLHHEASADVAHVNTVGVTASSTIDELIDALHTSYYHIGFAFPRVDVPGAMVQVVLLLGLVLIALKLAPEKRDYAAFVLAARSRIRAIMAFSPFER